MEIDDIVLPIDRLLAASQFTPPDNDDGTKGMQKRIEGIVKSGKGDYLKENGMPRVIVLCLSGLRCADVVRLVRDVRGKGEVAKVCGPLPFNISSNSFGDIGVADISSSRSI